MTEEQAQQIIEYLDALNTLQAKDHTYIMFIAVVLALTAGLYIGWRLGR